MNKYEAVVMFYPNIDEEKRNNDLERLKKIIDDNGKVNEVDEWGMRKLAYEIEYNKEAYYILITFEAEPEVIKEFTRVAGIMDSVMRTMVVKINK